jgi:hypothetical protein
MFGNFIDLQAVMRSDAAFRGLMRHQIQDLIVEPETLQDGADYGRRRMRQQEGIGQMIVYCSGTQAQGVDTTV